MVRQLLEAGHQVRALVRNLAKASEQFDTLTNANRLTLIEGDMGAVEAFASALDGVDGVIHTAAYFRDSYKGGEHFERMVKINVDATVALLQAGVDRGVHRFVHISSIATILPTAGVAGTEADRRPLEGEPDDYFRSKIMSDAAVESFLDAHPEVRLGYILPAFMVGPGDLGPTSSGQMVIDFATGSLAGVMDAGLSVVDARDVAAATIQLLANVDTLHRERFIVAGRFMTMAEMYAELATVTGRPAPTLRFPDFALKLFALGSEAFARVTGRPVLLSWSGVRNLLLERRRAVFDSSKATRTLGAQFRATQETFEDTYRDYLRRGQVPAPTGTNLHALST